jgi:hypothetical protein
MEYAAATLCFTERTEMNRYTLPSLACVSVSALVLSACGGDNNTPPGTGAFRLVDGISDSVGITASATSGFPSTQPATFDSASSIVDVPEGSYNVQLTSNGGSSGGSSSSSSSSSSGGSSSSSSSSGSSSSSSSSGGAGAGNDQFTTVNNVSVDHNNLTTLYTYGSVLGGTANGFAVEENIGQPPSGDFTFQFVNDTSQVATSTLNVYLVAPGTGSVSGAQPVATVNAQAASQANPFTSGTYEIIVTNGLGIVMYDSGKNNSGIVLPTANSNVIQIGALDATASQSAQYGAAGITVLITDNNGGETIHYNGNN